MLFENIHWTFHLSARRKRRNFFLTRNVNAKKILCINIYKLTRHVCSVLIAWFFKSSNGFQLKLSSARFPAQNLCFIFITRIFVRYRLKTETETFIRGLFATQKPMISRLYFYILYLKCFNAYKLEAISDKRGNYFCYLNISI